MPYKVSDRSWYLLLITFAWVYIWLRAALIPFQSDEAATFFMFVQTGNYLPQVSAHVANNHILNSFLTWISSLVFGTSPLALRLPNVFAALIYFYFIFMLSGQIRWAPAKWGFILLSTGTHFILEFFSYSRGYGLSMAFLSGALFELIILTNKFRLKAVLLSALFMLLATAANLNLIFISLSIYIFLIFFLFLKIKSLKKITILTGILLVLITGGLSSYYFIDFSMQIRKLAGFYYGSSNGFWPVTISSLAAMISGRLSFIIEIITVLAFFIAILLTITGLLLKKIKIDNPVSGYIIFLFLLLISWIAALLSNTILQVNYQEDRAAMHLLPIFYGMVFFGLDRLYPILKRYTLIAIIPFSIIPAISISQLSLDKSVYGNSQQVPAGFFNYISKESAERDFPPVVSSYQARRQVWAFMNYRAGGFLNPLQGSGYPNPSADFLIRGLPLPDSLKTIFEPVMTDQNTQTGLFRNTGLPETSLYKSFKIENSINTVNLYNELFKIDFDSLGGKTLRIETEMIIESPEKPLQAAVVVEVFDSNRKTLVYEALDLDQLRPAWDKQNHLFRHVMLISDIPMQSKSVLLYIWNKKQVQVSILSGNTNIWISN
jgi:hypothetical protein